MRQDVRRCGLDEPVVQAGPARFHLMLVQADGTWQYLVGLLSSGFGWCVIWNARSPSFAPEIPGNLSALPPA